MHWAAMALAGAAGNMFIVAVTGDVSLLWISAACLMFAAVVM